MLPNIKFKFCSTSLESPDTYDVKGLTIFNYTTRNYEQQITSTDKVKSGLKIRYNLF